MDDEQKAYSARLDIEAAIATLKECGWSNEEIEEFCDEQIEGSEAPYNPGPRKPKPGHE